LDFLLAEHFFQGYFLAIDNLEKKQTFPGKALEQITSKGHKFLPSISLISERHKGLLELLQFRKVFPHHAF